MAIRREKVVVTGASGGAGVATASARTSNIISGVVLNVYLKYTGSPPATTDVIIEETGTNDSDPDVMPVLTVSDSNSDGWQDVSSPGGNNNFVVTMDYLTVTIAQANNDDGVEAYIRWDDLKG